MTRQAESTRPRLIASAARRALGLNAPAALGDANDHRGDLTTNKKDAAGINPPRRIVLPKICKPFIGHLGGAVNNFLDRQVPVL